MQDFYMMKEEMLELTDGVLASRQTEDEALKMNAQRIRTLVNTMPLGLFITDECGLIEAANPAALNLFSCEYADLNNRNLGMFFRSQGLAIDFSLQGIDWDNAKVQESTARRPDGKEFPAQISVCLFSAPDAQKLMVMVEDVTAEREIEKMKQEFLSMVTHDLRAPLASIGMFVELIAAGTYRENQEKAMLMARQTSASAKRLINMIDSLLDMDRLEAGHLNLSFDAVSCAEIVDQASQALHALAEMRRITLSPCSIDSNIQVLADKEYIIQVLVNIISNAIKFSPPGKSVDITVESDDSMVTIRVMDEGPGVQQEFQERIFNRFEQARINDHRLKDGSGLGLAIAKAIIEQHGGTIGVESQESRGSTFWFTLKRVQT